MAKYHINKKGEPGACYATRKCPFGDVEDHYESKELARNAYETKMTNELIPQGNTASLGKRELNELAKITSDDALLNRMLAEGSERTLKNLARNANVDGPRLTEAYKLAQAPETRLALARNTNFPVHAMNSDDFVQVYKDGDYKSQRNLLNDNDVNDANVKALLKVEAERGRFTPAVDFGAILRNSDNKLSEDMVVDLAERNWRTLDAALMSNRYPADRIASLDRELIYGSSILHSKNSTYLEAYVQWAVNNKDDANGRQSQYTAGRVANNPSTPPATLHKLAENGLALEEVYRHPDATPETKALAVASSPEVARMKKLDKLEESYPGGLKNELIVNNSTSQPYRNRGLYDSTVKLDTSKVKALGLSKQDVFTLLKVGDYNGGYNYDENTGVFTGTIDSTD